ncbi:MAG: fused MFS/spermidine synthase, partial [bacterium]
MTGSSIYALAAVLSSFLGGIAVGAAVLRLRPPRDARAALAGCGIALLLPWAFTVLLPLWDRVPLVLFGIWRRFPPFPVLQGVNVVAATLLLLPVTGAFGYALPTLASALGPPGAARTGRLFAANTLGAAAGAPAAAFLLLPGLGLEGALIALGAAALLASTAAAALAFPGRRRLVALVLAPALALPVVLPRPAPPLLNTALHFRPRRFLEPPRRGTLEERVQAMGRIVYQQDGPTGRVAVRDDGESLTLLINGKPDASTDLGDASTMMLSAHLPFLYRPEARTGLLVGLGGGLTVASMLHHPLTELRVAEIEPAVVGAARVFHWRIRGAMDDPRLHVVLADGRRLLRASDRRYDVIVSEPSNVYVAGMVTLFTVDYYRLARSRLAPGGVFCQWAHYYGSTLEDCRIVARSFAAAFPHVAMWMHGFGDFFLLGAEDPLVIDLDAWRALLRQGEIARDLKRIRYTDALQLAAHCLMGDADVRRFAGAGPQCTDDRPVLEYTTPWVRDDSAL